MDFLNAFMVPVIIGICLCVGFVLKHFVPTSFINKYIPLVVALLGIILNVWMNRTFTADILLGGMVSGLASTGLHQVFTQFINKE